jgi:hypothetical protein
MYRGRRLGRMEDLPLFPGAQLTFPRYCSMQGKVREVVEVKIGQELTPRESNWSQTGR